MVIIDLILCLAAIIFAIIAAIKKYRKFNVLVVLSYVCYSLAILYSLYDMITRVNSNDIAGILDILSDYDYRISYSSCNCYNT